MHIAIIKISTPNRLLLGKFDNGWRNNELKIIKKLPKKIIIFIGIFNSNFFNIK